MSSKCTVARCNLNAICFVFHRSEHTRIDSTQFWHYILVVGKNRQNKKTKLSFIFAYATPYPACKPNHECYCHTRWPAMLIAFVFAIVWLVNCVARCPLLVHTTEAKHADNMAPTAALNVKKYRFCSHGNEKYWTNLVWKAIPPPKM